MSIVEPGGRQPARLEGGQLCDERPDKFTGNLRLRRRQVVGYMQDSYQVSERRACRAARLHGGDLSVSQS